MIFVLIVLFISIWLYVIFAGADLGAGILEIFKGKEYPREQENLVNSAMGPVWEANHIWLILAVVITFVGFPQIFREVSIVLHIPLTAILIGIVFRGSAFTFRHYDAVKDGSQKIYSKVFAYSSLWSTMWMGMTVGAIIEADFAVGAAKNDFYLTYISPWLRPFPILVGLFVSCLLAYITATFMVAEAGVREKPVYEEVQKLFRKRVTYFFLAAIPIGLAIIIYGQLNDIYSLKNFFSGPLSITCFTISTILIFVQFYVLKKHLNKWLKYLGVAQLTLILVGLISNQFPYLIHNEETQYILGFRESAAPESVMTQLVIALIIGTLVIFPPYIYMMKIFKKETVKN